MIDFTDTSKEEAWRLAKWGKFSASCIDVLTSKGVGEMFGKGAKTYIKKVAREAYTLFNTEEDVETYDMKMGKQREAQSYAAYRKAIGFDDLTYYGGNNPHFEPYDEHSGGSPDCVAKMSDGKVSFGAEFKNPKGDVHFDYLTNIRNQYDLYKAAPIYYGQCQFLLMIYKCDLWHWCSHNEFFPPRDRLLLIEVEPDKQYQDNLLLRLKQAIILKQLIIEVRTEGKGTIVWP